MAKYLPSVPRPISKYYLPFDLTTFSENGLCEPEDLTLLTTIAKELLNKYNLKFLGWARAKDKYLDRLSERNFGVAIIYTDENSNRGLAIIAKLDLVFLSVPFIDSLLDEN